MRCRAIVQITDGSIDRHKMDIVSVDILDDDIKILGEFPIVIKYKELSNANIRMISNIGTVIEFKYNDKKLFISIIRFDFFKKVVVINRNKTYELLDKISPNNSIINKLNPLIVIIIYVGGGLIGALITFILWYIKTTL